MERTEILATMGELKLYGMKAAFDEITTTAVKSPYVYARGGSGEGKPLRSRRQ
jgi:hypothetical protein